MLLIFEELDTSTIRCNCQVLKTFTRQNAR